jgi:hypothetical protein
MTVMLLFLFQYKFNPKTGEWKHELSQEGKQQRRLDQLSYEHGFLEARTPKSPKEDRPAPDYSQCLAAARRIFADAEQVSKHKIFRPIFSSKFVRFSALGSRC